MSRSPVIALISATPAAIAPAISALAAKFPESSPWNILDDRLMAEAKEQGGVTEKLTQRMNRLIDHAVREGADGILLTCSLYGAVAHDFPDVGVPILAADDAAFDTAAAGRHRRILVVASFDEARIDALERFQSVLDNAGSPAEVTSIVADGALPATTAKDDEMLFQALLTACREQQDDIDAILLAQYSLAPAATRLAGALGIPVISGPEAAADVLRERVRVAQ